MCEEKEKSKWEIRSNNIQVGIDWRHFIVFAQWNIGVECEKQPGKASLKSGFRLGFAGTVLNFLQKIKIEMSFVSLAVCNHTLPCTEGGLCNGQNWSNFDDDMKISAQRWQPMCDDVDSEKHRKCSVKDTMIAIKKTSPTTIAAARVCVAWKSIQLHHILFAVEFNIAHKNHFHAFALALATIRRANERVSSCSISDNEFTDNRCFFMLFNIFLWTSNWNRSE